MNWCCSGYHTWVQAEHAVDHCHEISTSQNGPAAFYASLYSHGTRKTVLKPMHKEVPQGRRYRVAGLWGPCLWGPCLMKLGEHAYKYTLCVYAGNSVMSGRLRSHVQAGCQRTSFTGLLSFQQSAS